MKLRDLVELIPPTAKSIKTTLQRGWIAKIGDLEATGDDASAAISKLKATIERTYAGDYCPHIITFRGYQGIAWREPRSWSYKILDQDRLAKCEGTLTRIWGSTCYDSQKEADEHLRMHLAQTAWDGQEESSPLIADAEHQERFGQWARWQKRYKELNDSADMDDTAIRYQMMLEGS